MIRFALFGCLALALAGAATAEDKKDVPKDLAPFQGTWKVAKAMVEGNPVPEKEVAEGRFIFEGSKLTVMEKQNSKPDLGSFAVDATKEPHTIDLVQDNGEKALGLYKFDKDGTLTLGFVKGKDAPRPKSFDDKKIVLVVLEKVKK